MLINQCFAGSTWASWSFCQNIWFLEALLENSSRMAAPFYLVYRWLYHFPIERKLHSNLQDAMITIYLLQVDIYDRIPIIFNIHFGIICLFFYILFVQTKFFFRNSRKRVGKFFVRSCFPKPFRLKVSILMQPY